MLNKDGVPFLSSSEKSSNKEDSVDLQNVVARALVRLDCGELDLDSLPLFIN